MQPSAHVALLPAPDITRLYLRRGTGVAELRYEADVPVTLSSILAAAFPTSLFRRPASAAASSTPTAASGGPAHQRQPSSSSQPRSQQRGRRPSQDASPDPFDQALQAERLELPGR